ncbi:MAG: AraC family transcriptional regulator, partial [Bacteroidota bacterium]
VDPAPLFRSAGVDPATLGVPGKRVSTRTALRLQRIVDEAIGDPALGLDVASQMQGTALHALGYAWLASATLGEAFRRFARYARVVSELWSLDIEESPTGARVSFVFPVGELRRPDWTHDWLAAGAVRLSRLIAGDAFAPLEVALPRERPADAAPFEQWFRAPIGWRAPQASVVCGNEDFSRELPTGNPEVAAATERLALEYLARLDRSDTVTQVRRRIRDRLPSGVPSHEEVARALALSPRTLTRRLEEAGTSFTAIVDETRRALAEQYLARTEFSVAEVAYLVGFAEASSFNRAFRRWTGRAPGEARAKA